MLSKMSVAIFAALLILVLAYLLTRPSTPQKFGVDGIRIGGKGYNAYVALTPNQQALGLMNATSVGSCNGAGNCIGMLFVFPTNGTNLCFWMKDTIMPLHQYWIRNGSVVYAYSAAPQSTNVVCHTADWVLETNITTNITIGQSVSMNLLPA